MQIQKDDGQLLFLIHFIYYYFLFNYIFPGMMESRQNLGAVTNQYPNTGPINPENQPHTNLDYLKIQQGDPTHAKIQIDDGVVLDDYYMGKDSNCFTRTLYLHFFNILPAYFTHFQNKKLINFRPQYEPMVSNKYLWHRFRNLRSNFNIYKQLFLAERGPLLAVLAISILIGVLALFGAYFQRYLFAQILDPAFPTSGWVYFGLISGSAILRFFLFNWAQNISNESAINVRCYIQNAIIKLIFYLPDSMSEGNLLNNMFISADVARSSIQLIPYFVSSVIIVFGIVAFIIDILGHIGWIVLGLTLLMLLIQILVLKKMLHLHHDYVHVADKRTSLLLQCTQGLMRLAKNGIAKIYFLMLDEERRKQTGIQMKYNFLDGFIQVLTQSISFISVFVFYVVSQATLRNFGQSTPNYKQIFQAVILFSVFKTPVKMVAYGLCMGLEGYAALHRLQQLFDKCGYVPPVIKNETFIRQYPNKSLFQSFLNVQPQSQNVLNNIMPTALHTLMPEDPRYKGKMTMILGKLDANPDCDKYLRIIEQNLPYRLSYYKIDSEALIEDKSIRENIVFGQSFDSKKYEQILQLMRLKPILSQFPEGDQTKMHENYFKTIYFGLQLKIELARALYCNIDVLAINRLVFKEYQTLLRNLKRYREQRGKTTIIVNLSGSHYHLADELIVLGKNGYTESGTYQQLKQKKEQILEQFQLQYNSHHQLIEQEQKNDSQKLQTHINKLEDKPIDIISFKFTDIFKFYKLSHITAPFILLFLIVLPPLLDLYMEVIVAESARIWESNNQAPVHSFLHDDFANSNDLRNPQTNWNSTNFQNPLNNNSNTQIPLLSGLPLSQTAATSQTTTQESETVLNFDHIITLRYGVTAITFVCANLLKILVFSLYLKISGYRIVRKLASRMFSRKIQSILSASNRRNALNLQRNIDNIDTRVTADLDVGMTIIFQQLTALIFGAVSSVLFLAIGVPFFVVTCIIILSMIKFNRKILMLRRDARSKFNSFIKKLILHRKIYVHMKKTKYITADFIKNNKIDIIADLNEEWMMESLGMIMQVVFILLLIVTMAVSLVKYKQIHYSNPAFLELAISFLIGMTNGGRINLKIFQSMDFQLVGITSLFKIIDRHEQNKDYIHEHYDIEEHRNHAQKNRDNPQYINHLILADNFQLEVLKFDNFHVKFKDDILENINLEIRRGDRIVVTGSRRGGKRIIIYGMMGIFQSKHVSGDIQLNGQFHIYKDRISKHTIAKLVLVLDVQSYSQLGTQHIKDSIFMGEAGISYQDLQNKLKQLWKVLQIQPLFDLDTSIKDLSQPQIELLSLTRALLLKPAILVIEDGLDHIDSVNRRKLTKWLISNQQIPILIDLTNRIEVIREYGRQLHFANGKLTKDIKL